MSWDFKRIPEPLVAHNSFRTLEAGEAVAFPSFDSARPGLPVPVLPAAHAGWLDLYWHAWEGLWSRITPPPPASGLIAPVTPPSRFAGQDVETTCFIARLAGYSQRATDLIQLLDNFYQRQHDTGFISREIAPDTGEDCFTEFEPNGAGPELFSWTEWRRFRLTGDEERLKAAFWPMMAYHRWCRLNRTWPNGLYWATGYSSGLVNQPRVPNGRSHHRHWTWLDATLQASIDCLLLGRMATMMAELELAEELTAERAHLVEQINGELWNDEAEFYQDVGPDGQFSEVKSIAAYWALIDRTLVPKERITPFVQLLRETWAFKTPYRVPSLSADSSRYEGPTGNGWRGAIWPHLNYVTLRGLRATGQHTLVQEIALNHLGQVEAVYRDTGSLWASYAPEMACPGDPAEMDRSGLTAASTILTLLEAAIGLSVDWPLRQVTWHRFLPTDEEYGVRNFPLDAEGTLDLLGNSERVMVSTDTPLTLVIRDGMEEMQIAVPAGTSEIRMS